VPASDVEAPDEYRERMPLALKNRLPLFVKLREFWGSLPGPSHRVALTGPDLLHAFIDADVRVRLRARRPWSSARNRCPRRVVEATRENASRIMRALGAFGAPLAGLAEQDCARESVTHQMGVEPGRIDVLTELTGITFGDAWPGRVRERFGDVDVDFIGRASFIRNKRATARPKDLADIDGLEWLGAQTSHLVTGIRASTARHYSAV
jgi:hypothetical protein